MSGTFIQIRLAPTPEGKIDKAHLIMLMENRIIPREKGRQLLRLINELIQVNFFPLHNMHAPRGIYLLYEEYLIKTLGSEIGGILQTGRSRNDLNATILKLRLRDGFIKLVRHLLGFQRILIKKAIEYKNIIMPLFTHFQPALPTTYGHYLSGIAFALATDIDVFFNLVPLLNICPLGAGAGGGTSLPINHKRTASLLGFDINIIHSIDAVASRDLVVRILSNLTSLGLTISRFSMDIIFWNSPGNSFLYLPDHLISSSSMMPQKRNPFLLEIIKGKTAKTIGNFVSCTTAIHSTPFTNSVAVGTEAVKPLWDAIDDYFDIITIMKEIVKEAKPDPVTMMKQTITGLTYTTEIANYLVNKKIFSFRDAHHFIGQMITQASQEGCNLEKLLQKWQKENEYKLELTEINSNIEKIVSSTQFGGGPGSNDDIIDHLKSHYKKMYDKLKAIFHQWNLAKKTLEKEVEKVVIPEDEER
jgi:argininosuccinate lyase